MVIIKSMKLLPVPRRTRQGYALIEANIATGMVGVFIAAVMMMNSNLLGIIKTARESSSANQSLQERVELMRIANWVQITDSNYLANNLLNTATGSAVGLPSLAETMTITSADNPSMAPAKVIRSGNSVRVTSSNSTLQNERMVRVDLKLVWQGLDRRQHTRSTCALIAKGGIAK
jgi:Tfp pilus assembly protein PilV